MNPVLTSSPPVDSHRLAGSRVWGASGHECKGVPRRSHRQRLLAQGEAQLRRVLERSARPISVLIAVPWPLLEQTDLMCHNGLALKGSLHRAGIFARTRRAVRSSVPGRKSCERGRKAQR